MNDKLNFKDWYKEKYDPTGYLYPSAPLSIGFQDYCARVNEYLEYLANGVDTRTEPALPIQNVGGSLLHKNLIKKTKTKMTKWQRNLNFQKKE